ncbi:MAG: hypothetical protein KDA99_07280, partial [Planctomycetales bacterium]|nr:hypothetical protein [Planctomycetales bacterium]
MPATEKTWRDQKVLHAVFAASSLVMFIATVWMFAQDHRREWKVFQRKYRDIEQTLTDWKIDDQETADKALEHSKLESELLTLQSAAISKADFQSIVDLINKDLADRNEPPINFDRQADERDSLDKAAAEAAKQRQAAEQAQADAEQAWAAVRDAAAGEPRQTARKTAEGKQQAADDAQQESLESQRSAAKIRTQILGRFDALLADAKFREVNLIGQRKFKSADFDELRATHGIAVD